jgi:hypothetical protein
VSTLSPDIHALLHAGHIIGRSGKVFRDLGALSTTNNLIILAGLIQKLQPKRTLEIGMSFGGSAFLFAEGHRRLGQPAAKQHVVLDPFQSTVWDDCGLLAIERAELAGYMDFRPDKSCLALPDLLREEARFDLAYIDGSHLFEDVFVDAYYVMRLLSPHGIVAFDDSTNSHVRKVLRFVDRVLPESLRRVDLSAYRQSGGIRYRVASWLGHAQMTAYQRVGDVDRAWNSQFIAF